MPNILYAVSVKW